MTGVIERPTPGTTRQCCITAAITDLPPFRDAVNSGIENHHQKVRSLCGFPKASACSALLNQRYAVLPPARNP
jgi:hypothetical protein